ncbi:MAG: hypothetical protein J6B82_01570 [Bacteroidaceae bacterium]|nr:hypothetical protein [Bacteroidaceae bacterium]
MKRYFILFAVVLLTACGEEEYVFPDLITEMSCLRTDSKGFGTQIITDEGTIWHLQEGSRPDSLTADSLYRVVSRFAPVADSEAVAYSFWKVISPLPKPESEYESIHLDPVDIQSIWQSGDYLNMVLQVMVKDKEHELSFINNGITSNTNGTQTLHLTLFHHRKDDVEGFMQKYYLSVPLWHYEGKLNKGDTIVFELYTYKEGMTQRTFTY